MRLDAGLLLLSVVARTQPDVSVVHPPHVPPTQAEIARAIEVNKAQLTDCYERARSHNDALAGGTIMVTLSIAPFGRVRSVKISTTTPLLRVLDKCLREAISRWAFPGAPRNYRIEFPLVFPAICTMSIWSAPWSEVWVDGKDTRRHTPFVDDHLACGEHTLTLKRPDLLIEKTESIRVKAGRRLERHYTLVKGD